MDRNASRRSEAIAIVDDLAKNTAQHREELSKELAELDARRFDLRDTIDILNHQLEGYQAVLERANNPKLAAVDESKLNATMAAKAIRERW
jgi:hypothetical protein